MKKALSNNPEFHKSIEFIVEPDQRNKSFACFDPAINNFRPKTLSDHYASIENYILSSNVPADVVTHYETGINLYLYSWYVYRFYPVAELHAHATLELALKERIGEGNLQEACLIVGKNQGKKKGAQRGLNTYMLYAIDQGWVSNEGFQRWWDRARLRAEYRATIELSQEMDRTGATESELDFSQVELTAQDKDFDLIGILAKSFPKIRNEYAHGSCMLHNQVSGTFEIVAEFINQLWPASELQGAGPTAISMTSSSRNGDGGCKTSDSNLEP